jgi:hypothetical protein
MDRSFARDIEQKLRKIWHKVSPPDPARRYQRRLNNELSRVARAFKETDRIVLTHTYGKVGSTTVHKTIDKQPGYQSFQTHVISEEGVAESRQSCPEDPEEIHLLVGEALRLALERYPDRQVRVITLVRDPVARAVSDIFENPARFVGDGEISGVPLEKLVAIAAGHALQSIDFAEKWFDRELSAIVGFDFFTRDFDRMKGFELYQEGRFELLAGKLEQLSDNGAGYLGRFLDMGGDFPVSTTRARSATADALLYEQVRKNLKLPAEALDEVYNGRVFKHFYSDEELDRFRRRWIES